MLLHNSSPSASTDVVIDSLGPKPSEATLNTDLEEHVSCTTSSHASLCLDSLHRYVTWLLRATNMFVNHTDVSGNSRKVCGGS